MNDNWMVRLICCGHNDGAQVLATWQEADDFREQYVASNGGHERSGIVERAPGGLTIGSHTEYRLAVARAVPGEKP